MDESFDAVLFIGYHATASTHHSFPSYMIGGRVFLEIRINDVRAGEYLLNTLATGEKDVSAILVAGDKYLEEVGEYTP